MADPTDTPKSPHDEAPLGPSVFDGKLFFRLLDGSTVTCECIGEPYASQIVAACRPGTRLGIGTFNMPELREPLADDPKTPEMVERVARALHCQFHAATKDGREGGSAQAAWERSEVPYGGDQEWREAARAAIAAMREPTEAMIQAGILAVRGIRTDGWEDDMRRIFPAMIDTARGE